MNRKDKCIISKNIKRIVSVTEYQAKVQECHANEHVTELKQKVMLTTHGMFFLWEEDGGGSEWI